MDCLAGAPPACAGKAMLLRRRSTCLNSTNDVSLVSSDWLVAHHDASPVPSEELEESFLFKQLCQLVDIDVGH